MVWLKSSESQVLKTFCLLKISWILRKLWAKMCVYVLFPSSTSSTYIALQPLCVFDLSLTTFTCFNIQYLMEWLKSSESQLLKTFCLLKISWILRKLWAKMCVYALFPSSMSSTYIALQPLYVFDLSSTSSTSLTLLWSLVLIYLNTSNIKQYVLTCTL